MRSFRVACVLLVAAVAVHAEPPRFRSNRFQFQRQEQEPSIAPVEEGSGAEGPYPAAMPAPYPPSNWKPSGRLFALPSRQSQPPKDTYGPPPTQVYGPPPTTVDVTSEAEPTTAAPEEGDTEDNVTTEPLSEDVEVDDKAQEGEPKSERLTQGGPGFYYVQLPQLQTGQVAQQQIYVAPQAQTSAQLKALPTTVDQPLVYASQPLVYTNAYYVSTQTW